MAFGKNQLSNPTPAGTSMIIDVISAVAGVLVTWILSANFIPNNISNVVGSILGLVILLSQALKPFFGVKITGSSVPADQVTGMEQPDKPLPYSSPKDSELNK